MSSQPASIPSLNNLQKELLRLYAHQVQDEDLIAIRTMIGLYFAEKATRAMDAFTAEQSLSPQEIANWAYEHWRTQNRS
jgi:hypothetical protein